jgi:hypothetical protein
MLRKHVKVITANVLVKRNVLVSLVHALVIRQDAQVSAVKLKRVNHKKAPGKGLFLQYLLF